MSSGDRGSVQLGMWSVVCGLWISWVVFENHLPGESFTSSRTCLTSKAPHQNIETESRFERPATLCDGVSHCSSR